MSIWLKSAQTYNRFVMSILVGTMLIVFCLNYIVDPFNKNRLFSLDLPKSTISFRMNYQLYKILQFSKKPQPFIILGDSRAATLKETLFREAGVHNVYNFSYGGGTLYEAIDTFWFATEQIKLQKVIIGVPFNLFNASNNKNRFSQVIEVSKKPLSYYFSYLVTKASIFNILTHLTGKEFKTEKPPMNKDQFWEQQLGATTSRYYGNWRKPTKLYGELSEVADYCTKNNIELLFFLPPTHIELQNKVIEYGLHDHYMRYKKELQKLGDVIDFDFKNSVTVNADNFLDPYHSNKSVARDIVREIVSPSKRNTKFSRILRRESESITNR